MLFAESDNMCYSMGSPVYVCVCVGGGGHFHNYVRYVPLEMETLSFSPKFPLRSI